MQAGWQEAMRSGPVADSASYDTAEIPLFPWPPPRASARAKIPLGLQEISGATLSDVSSVLEEAFLSAGYGDISYFAIPEGFALVSRLEQINADGTPKEEPDRWSTRVRPFTKFSLTAYVRALFSATPGHFRVVVFMVTPVPFSQQNLEVTSAEATAWLAEGLDALPKSIGAVKVTRETKVTALIYEFVRPALDDPVVLKDPSEHLGTTHLERSRLSLRLRFDDLRQPD